MPEREDNGSIDEGELLAGHAGHPAESEMNPGAILMSPVSYRDEDLDEKLKDFEGDEKNEWLTRLKEKGREYKAFATANGTQILVYTAAGLAIGAVAAVAVHKYNKGKKSE